jgi:NADH:ubiquinone reductase (non-electrogenic)
MVFTPLLASTATGTLEFRSISEPVRYTCPHIQFQRGKCQTIDPASKTLTVRAERPWAPSSAAAAADQGVDLPNPPESLEMEIEYDALAIAVGARNTTFGVQGVAEHALFLKELSDARAIRRTIIRNFEQASFVGTSEEDRKRLLSFVIVGGGPTGIEFAAELHDLIKEDLSWQYPDIVAQASIKVVERGDVLGAFDEGLRNYCRTRFARQGIAIVRASVSEVRSGELVIEEGAAIPFGMLVWSTGIAPRQLVASRVGEEFRRDGWGHLVVDQFLRAETPPAELQAPPADETPAEHAEAPFPEAALGAALRSNEVLPGIFALGDCAAVEGKRLAATAQVAEQQGAWLAAEMNKRPTWATGQDDSWLPVEGFAYEHKGSLAYVGSWTSVSDFTAADAKAFEAVKGSTIQGWVSWLVWRSAYLTKLGTWRNRLQVPCDWLRTFLWGRDTSLF